MSPRSSTVHPDHAAEQAYIEAVHEAAERSRDRLEKLPESAGDKYSARKARERMLERLAEDIDPEALCFARIDRGSGETFYLGRQAVHDEGSKLLVVNWRMPVAAPFYTATPQDPQGLSRRRRFELDRSRLLGIVDNVFDRNHVPPRPNAPPREPTAEEPAPSTQPAEPAPVEALPEDEAPAVEPQLVDAILADMERARGSEMRDIVATIEKQQYELISDSIDGVLTIQGGPGSGKTAIALHRAAWLLFNHQEELERSGVLVVGPNRAFMEYVGHVLPSLGETSVVQRAVDRLADLPDLRVRGTENSEVARLKGDIRMAQVIQRAVHARVREPSEPVSVTVGRNELQLPQERVRELVVEAWRDGGTYLRSRDRFGRTLVGLAQEHAGRGGLFRSGPSGEDVEAAIRGPGGALDRIWPTVTAPEVLRDLFNSAQRLANAASMLTEAERNLLRRERGRFLREEPWTAADIPLLDEADAALRGPASSYGYVLADEAQDLSPMQLRMIFRRSPQNRGTLVGDIAQATGPARFRDWVELVNAAELDAEPRIAELMVGYRVPRQIMDLAAQLLPRIAPEIALPRAVREGPEEPRLLQVDDESLADTVVAEVKRRVEGERSVGLVGPSEQTGHLRSVLEGAGLPAGDVLTDGLERQVTVLSADQVKGLEFDHVLVVDPVGIAGAAEDWAYVYIALTRATHTLSVIYTTPEPFEVPPTEEPPEPVEIPPAPPTLAPVPAAEAGTHLGARYTEAWVQAKFLHAGQYRRGTRVPYLAHLQAVASLVLEDGGSEDEAIAALLHDAVEDRGSDVLTQIAEQFGLNVARIVLGCTDPDEEGGATWRERKAEHLRALEAAGPQVRRVALAEKLDNARALLRDYRRFEDRLWDQMKVDAEDLLWYEAALADLFVTERPGDMASELRDTVETLLDLASAPEPAG